MNREQWLTEIAFQVEPFFKGFKLRPYRVTCSWPSHGAFGNQRVVLGQCFSLEHSKAGVNEIFISPLMDKPLQVVGTLCHELAHVAAGPWANHGEGFLKVCRHVGITRGRARSIMPGDRLNGELNKQGEYPHKAIVPVMKKVARSQGMLRLECQGCGCVCMISVKWLDEAGCPTCGCGLPMVKISSKDS